MNQYRRRSILRCILLSLAYPLRLSAQQRDKPGQSENRDTSTVADVTFEQAFAGVQQKAIDYHRKIGYHPVDRKPLLTGHPFNGGLRYDESGTLKEAPNQAMIVQDCARIADITERERHDILPYFHIFGCNWRNYTDRAQIIGDALAFLNGPVGLTPQRLALVSVEALASYRDVLAEHDIDWRRQVVIRNTEEAKAAGDGSGFFRPENHPEQPAFSCMGIYAWLGEGDAPAVQSYPLPTQWTEIGELVLDPGAEVAYAFGLERLVYVTTSLWPSWHDRRKQLLTRVETEVAASGEAFPEGYYLFKG